MNSFDFELLKTLSTAHFSVRHLYLIRYLIPNISCKTELYYAKSHFYLERYEFLTKIDLFRFKDHRS